MYPDAIWKRGMHSLAELLQGIDWHKETLEIYQQIAERLIDAAECDSVSIRLLALTGDEMIGYVFAGAAEPLAKAQFPTLPQGVGRMNRIFEEQRPLVYDFNDPDDQDIQSEDGVKLGYSHAVVVPLVAGDSTVGTVDFMFKDGQYDSSEDNVAFLNELCRIIGPLSDLLSITDELVELRVSEEGKRIGSELHDNFAEPLSVIALEADKALLAQEEADERQVNDSLTKISTLSRQSFGMMVDEVALLHSASKMSEDLIEDIRRYVTNFQAQWGIDIDLVTPDEALVVSRNVGNQAMRILHEALSNVLRHSRDYHSIVSVVNEGRAIGLSIEDRGCGFDIKRRVSGSLGLRLMEERARCVGGRLAIASVISEGTTVFADLPRIA